MPILIYILISKESFYFVSFVSTRSNESPLQISYTLSSARELLNQRKADFKLPSNFNSEEFRMVANGFFQAEGHISCRIRGRYFSPVLVVNQNLSLKSLEFFLTLWHVLGRTGSLTLIKNKNEKLVIRLSSENWYVILNSFAKYFDYIYGEKFVAFQKLSTIRQLTSKQLYLDPSSLALAVHLVYSISAYGVVRKLSLLEQLSLFCISPTNIDIPNYTDNYKKVTILFIIGMILGDGTLHLRLRNSDKGSIWLIPALFIPQLKNKYSVHFFSLLEDFFKSREIKVYTVNNAKDPEFLDILSSSTNLDRDNIKKMTILTVEGIQSMFNLLIPLMKPYSQYFYWKFDQFELMLRLALLVNAKAHLTLYGFKTIIEIIYSYPNKRNKSKDFWIDIIESWFKSQAAENKSAENNIQAVFGRGTLSGQIIAWKCVFNSNSNLKSKQFGFTNIADSRVALKQAIDYRDSTIKSWVDSIK